VLHSKVGYWPYLQNRPARDKHSRLFVLLVTYEGKSFYNIGPRATIDAKRFVKFVPVQTAIKSAVQLFDDVREVDAIYAQCNKTFFVVIKLLSA
jgi:hypothetical protein